MAQPNEALQELVDSPSEVLSVEYKSWLDLANNEARADLARHIAALANYGGGFVVFGFNDEDLSYAGANPHATAIDRDIISSLIKRYLDPSFQCDVRLVRSQAGNEHPVIVVPGHGAAPICAKAGGPQIGGKVQGIIAGTFYTRKAGPESDAIRTPTEWAPTIRRCALHERAAIFAALGAALSGTPTAAADTDALKIWHEAAHTAFLRDVEQFYRPDAASCEAWPGLDKRHYQLSYRVEFAGGPGLRPEQMLEALREISHEVTSGTDIGSPFYPYTRLDISPRFTVDEASGLGHADFLECSLLRDPDRATLGPTFWRVSSDGKATLIDAYKEDDPGWCEICNVRPGTLLSPNITVQLLAGVVRHARAMAERFDSATGCRFRRSRPGIPI